MTNTLTKISFFKILKLTIFFLIGLTITPSYSQAFCFKEAGQTYSVSPKLLRAIVKVESSNNPKAIGKGGEKGLMQIHPYWKKELGINLWDSLLDDPCLNVKTGAWILSDCMRQYGNNWEAVGCYNAKSTNKKIKYAWKVYEALNNWNK